LNAIEKMFSVGRELENLSLSLSTKSHYLVGHPTLSIGTIKGGTVTNAVPDQCTMSIDRRLIPGETAEEAEAELRELLGSIEGMDPEFKAELEVPVAAMPMETSEDEPVVQAVRAATESVLGEDPGVHGWSATCDANILVNEMGIPSVIFGPGDIAAAHKPDEYIEIDQLVQATKIYSLTLLKLLG
jgi:acetylornithine deacetylase/succinyl-diaminopimelate desuccinylase-like protein